jgi:hypothetical protein
LPRKPSVRVVLNRSRLTPDALGLVDGFSEVGKTIIETADPPDATPHGEGLVTSGGYLVYADGKKVDGWHQRGGQPKAPRKAQVSKTTGVTLIVGWGFPARFQEFGVVHHGPQPFATPARDQVAPAIPDIVSQFTPHEGIG